MLVDALHLLDMLLMFGEKPTFLSPLQSRADTWTWAQPIRCTGQVASLVPGVDFAAEQIIVGKWVVVAARPHQSSPEFWQS